MANNPQSSGVQPVHPLILGHAGPPNPVPPMPMQFRSAIPPPPQPFVPVAPQQFQPGGHMNMGMPLPLPPHIQYPSVAPPLPPLPRSSLAGHALPQGPQLLQPDVHPNRPLMPGPSQPQISSNFMPSFGGPRNSNIPYNLSSSSGGQQPMNAIPAVRHQPMPQTDALNYSAGGQPWYPAGNQNIQSVVPTQQAGEQSSTGLGWYSTGAQSIKAVTPLEQKREQSAGAQQWYPHVNQQVQSGTPQKTEQSTDAGKRVKPEPAVSTPSDWIEHTSREGKRYYYNKKTKVSSWEKPIELMTPTERADSSTDWREFLSPEGRRYYYNKVTRISKWAMPDEVKLARERANLIQFEGTPTKKDVNSRVSVPVSVPGTESSTPNANNLPSSVAQEKEPSPISVTTAATQEPVVASVLSSMQVEVTNLKSEATEQHTPLELVTSTVPETPVHVPTTTAMTPPLGISTMSPQDAGHSVKSSTGSAEETTKSAEISGSGNMSAQEGGGTTVVEGTKVDHGAVYESKTEAKSAFKALLESANVGLDWNWDQAMRVIINDRRYGALKTLGEKKQVFNEFVVHKKKQEAEEKRSKQKKAREDFKKMLRESKDLTLSTRWSKVVSMFEKDERFIAVERVKDRQDLLEEHLEELKKKERSKAAEEQKRHKAEYLEFLKSCDFVKASSQWRKVQHRLEADERCSRLEKFERMQIFQEYIRDLELEEEEHIKIRMEEQRKAERKNRDEFRKLMEEHVASGILTANSHWREYCMKVKDEPSFMAVSSNTSGATAKDLFEHVLEDLEKQFLDDKEEVEEVMKSKKISLSSTWTFEDFKGIFDREVGSKSISDVNLKLIFDELMDGVKEKDEKESKKRKRLTDDVYTFLFSSTGITSSSKWEDFKPLVEERFVGEESYFEEIFDRVIHDLKEKAKEKDRKRKEEKAKKEKERKEKEKKEKERKHKPRVYSKRKSKDRHKVDETDSDESESSLEESRRSRERSKKHQKRAISSYDDASLDDDAKDHSRSHRRGSDSKKSKKMEKQTRAGDEYSESQSKRHKRSHWDGSSLNTIREEYKDEDDGEDREMQ